MDRMGTRSPPTVQHRAQDWQNWSLIYGISCLVLGILLGQEFNPHFRCFLHLRFSGYSWFQEHFPCIVIAFIRLIQYISCCLRQPGPLSCLSKPVLALTPQGTRRCCARTESTVQMLGFAIPVEEIAIKGHALCTHCSLRSTLMGLRYQEEAI